MSSVEARQQQAQVELLTLLVAGGRRAVIGVIGVAHRPGNPKPYQAQVWRGGKEVSLGSFATAEEAALCVARTPEGKAAAVEERAAAAAPLTSEEARQHAQVEKLTLLAAENKAGYFGVHHRPGRPEPYQAAVKRGGNNVSLGTFTTAEEAALRVARTPEGKAAAERAAPAPPLTSEEARQQAQAEKLTLLAAENKAGYFGVHLDKCIPLKPYKARVTRGGKNVSLGYFATAEEAALCVARTPEGQAAAAARAAAAPPLTSEEARQQAKAEKLTLVVAESSTGYFGVHLNNPGQPKPYQARVKRGGKNVSLGCFATAEEAALCVARTPEGQAAAVEKAAAAGRAAAAPVLTSEEARQQARAEGLTLRLAETQTGYLGVSRPNPGKPKPYQARVKRGGKRVNLGTFATAEEAALCVARASEGQAAATEASPRHRVGKAARGERSSPSTTFWSELSGVYSVVSQGVGGLQ